MDEPSTVSILAGNAIVGKCLISKCTVDDMLFGCICPFVISSTLLSDNTGAFLSLLLYIQPMDVFLTNSYSLIHTHAYILYIHGVICNLCSCIP
jgi:hypothetical protein